MGMEELSTMMVPFTRAASTMALLSAIKHFSSGEMEASTEVR